MDQDANDRALTSWKEIAQYLGFNQRTCLRWEKRLGLPIYRIDPESSRSRVFAYARELDEWLKGRKLGSISPNQSASSKFGSDGKDVSANSKQYPPRLRWLLALLLALISLATLYLIFRPAGISDPADFRIRGSVLTILDAKGRELQSYDTGFEQLKDESYYRLHFQHKRMLDRPDNPLFPFLILKDINSDSRIEVIFTAQLSDNNDSGPVICFDHKGRKLWDFEPGREITFGPNRYSNDYAVQFLDLCDLEGDGKKEVIVVANQIPFFPTQVVVLDAGGKVLGKYWNAGRIRNYAALDLNGDGRKEIAFGGKNNEYRKPCLFILDSNRIAGGSPQVKDEYICKSIGPGTQRSYLLFPQTEIGLIENISGDSVIDVSVLKNGNLSLWTHASLVNYEITPRLTVAAVRLSDTFRKKYGNYQTQGKIKPGELDETIYTQSLARQILYFDGKGWTTAPSLR